MISVTLLSAYHYCRRKLFLEYVLKIVPPPREVLVKGSIRHNCFDTINKLEKGIVVSIIKPLPKEEIFGIYKVRYSKALRSAIIMNKRGISELKLEMNELFREIMPSFIDEAREGRIISAALLKKTIFSAMSYGNPLFQRSSQS